MTDPYGFLYFGNFFFFQSLFKYVFNPRKFASIDIDTKEFLSAVAFNIKECDMKKLYIVSRRAEF